MISVSLSLSKVKILEIEKNMFGKLLVKSGGVADSASETDWKEKVEPLLRNQHVGFALSDSKFFIFRFEVASDIAREVLQATIFEKVKQIIPLPLENLLYDFKFFRRKDDNSQHVLFIASTIEHILPVYESWKKNEGKSLFIVPQCLSVFQMLQLGISHEEKILFINAEKENATITFYDFYGPIMNLSDPIPLDNLSTGIKKALTYFMEKYKTDITSVLIGGGAEDRVDVAKVEEAAKASVVKADTIFGDTVVSLGIQFNPDISPTNFMDTLGVGVLGFDKESLNLMNSKTALMLEEALSYKDTKTDIVSNASPVEVKEHDNPDTSSPFRSHAPIQQKKSSFAIFIIMGILFASMGIGFLLFSNKINMPTQKSVPQKEISPTSTPIPTPVPDKTELTVNVLNGSGQRGAAVDFSDMLKKKGYTQISTGNADNFAYESVTIKLKEKFKSFASLLESDLKDLYTVSFGENLGQDDSFDAVIIVGK